VTYLHTRDGVAQRFVEDMRATVEEIMKTPKAEAEGAVSFSSNFTLICFNNCIYCMVRLLSMEWHKVFLTVQW
jgi:hypothetical protein